MTGVKRSDQDATEHDIIRVDTSHSGASTAATGEQGSAPNTSASASTSYPVAHSPSEAPTSSSSSSPTTTMRNHLREVDKGGPRVYQCLGGDKGLAEVGPVERSSGASGWNEAPLDSAHKAKEAHAHEVLTVSPTSVVRELPPATEHAPNLRRRGSKA